VGDQRSILEKQPLYKTATALYIVEKLHFRITLRRFYSRTLSVVHRGELQAGYLPFALQTFLKGLAVTDLVSIKVPINCSAPTDALHFVANLFQNCMLKVESVGSVLKASSMINHLWA